MLEGKESGKRYPDHNDFTTKAVARDKIVNTRTQIVHLDKG